MTCFFFLKKKKKIDWVDMIIEEINPSYSHQIKQGLPSRMKKTHGSARTDTFVVALWIGVARSFERLENAKLRVYSYNKPIIFLKQSCFLSSQGM